MHSRPADHGQVRDLEPAEAVRTRHRHAGLELPVRRAHSPLQVVAVAETAHRRCLGLERAGVAREAARELVLAHAVGVAAERKEEVAAQVMQARQVERERGSGGQRLGLVERGEAVGDAVVDAHACGHRDQRSCAFAGVRGGLERGTRRLDRLARPADLDEQPAARHQQCESRLLRDGEREAALDQRQRRGVAKLLGEREARVEVRGGGARIVGTVEVLGGEHAVAVREPLGGAGVQGAPALVEQRCVGTVADQRMAEHELAAVGADEEVLDQETRVVAGAVEKMAQRFHRETLAEHRGRLQGRLVFAGEAVHARVDERLDRAGQAGLRGGAGIEEQLEQEQRVAFGALDAARDQRRRHGRGERGQSLRILARQRSEVDPGERRAVQRGAPGARARIAGEARRHHQQQRLPRGQHGQRGEALERPGIGPVDVLDDEEQRQRRADRGDDVAQRMQRALLARRRAHRRGERAQLDRRGDVEQVVQEEELLGRHRPCLVRTLDRRPSRRLVGDAVDAEQAAREAAHRVATGLRAEVEHRCAVA